MGAGKKKSSRAAKAEVKDEAAAGGVAEEPAEQARLIQDYLKERLEEAQAADGSEAAAGAAWPGCAARASSDGAAALRLLQPELRVPLADLPQAVRAAVQAGRIKGSLEMRLRHIAAALTKGPVQYQTLGVAFLGRVHEAKSFPDAAAFEVSVLQQLHKPVLLQRLKAQKERAPAARIVAEALTQVGLREEECLDDALVQVGPEAHRLLYALTITEASASASDGRNEESAAPLEPLAAGLLQQLRGVRIGEAVPRGDVCDAAAAALSEMGQLEEERAGLRRQPWEEPWAELEEAAAQLHAGCRRAELIVDSVAPGSFAARLCARKLLESAGRSQLEPALAAVLRGHLLLQLLHRAREEKLEGNCAALQDLIRPLQVAMAEPGTTARDLFSLCTFLSGAPKLSEQLEGLAEAVLSRGDGRGMFSLQLAAMMLLLSLEQPLDGEDAALALAQRPEAAHPAPQGEQPVGTGPECGNVAAAAAAPAVSPGPQGAAGYPPASALGSCGEDGDSDLAQFFVRRLAQQQREMVTRSLLGLQHMVQRRRLSLPLFGVLHDWLLGYCPADLQPGKGSDRFIKAAGKIPLLRADCLLAFYTFVAAAMGEAFRTPEDLGGFLCPQIKLRPGHAELPDFAEAAAAAGASGVTWVPGGGSGSGSGGKGSGPAQLGLSPAAVECCLHQADVARALHLRGDPHLQPGLCLQCGAVKPAAADAEACLGVIGALATAPACPPCGAGSALDTLRRCEAVLAGKSVLAEDTLLPQSRLQAGQAMRTMTVLAYTGSACMALGFHLDGHLDGMKADVDLLHLTCDAAQQSGQLALAPDDLRGLAARLAAHAEDFRRLAVVRKMLVQLGMEGLSERLAALQASGMAAAMAQRAGEEDASAAQQLLRNCACELQLLVVECQIELEESQKDMDKKEGSPAAVLGKARVLLGLMAGSEGRPPPPPADVQQYAQQLAPLVLEFLLLVRLAEGLCLGLCLEASSYHWKALDVASHLRQACSVYLPAALEEVAVHAVGTRLRAAARAAGHAPNAGEEGDAAAQAAAQAQREAEAAAAAAALLEEEEKRQNKEEQRRLEESQRRRAAEDKRRQQQAEERAQRRQREREEEAERRQRKQEDDENERRRERQRGDEQTRLRELERLEAEEERQRQQWLQAHKPLPGTEGGRQGETAERKGDGSGGAVSSQATVKEAMEEGATEASCQLTACSGQEQAGRDAQQQARGHSASASNGRAARVGQSRGRARSRKAAAAALPSEPPEQAPSRAGSGSGSSMSRMGEVTTGAVGGLACNSADQQPQLAADSRHAAKPGQPPRADAAAAPAVLQHPDTAASSEPETVPPTPTGSDGWVRAARCPSHAGSDALEVEQLLLETRQQVDGGGDQQAPLADGRPAQIGDTCATAGMLGKPAAAAGPPAGSWAALASQRAKPAEALQPDGGQSSADDWHGRPLARPAVHEPAAGKAARQPLNNRATALALPGLRNEAGDFNCFLNVVLQCLWRCADFRRQVLSWSPTVYRADPVLLNLAALFQELTRADSATSSGSLVRHQHVVIDPTPLREAINALPGQEFKLGEMSDAGELLLVLFEHMKSVAPAVAGTAVDAVFGLRVAEAVECQNCGRETQQSSYTQYFFNTFAAALRSSLAAGPDPGFGARLRRIEDEHKKSCDTDVGGCGTLHPVRQELEGEPPRVFTLQLVWESHEEEPASIGATLRAITDQIDLGQLYTDLMPGTLYRLRAMVCYYGRHYSAFVHLPQLSRWVAFDDSSASITGAWYDVRMRCESGRVQPSVLFYEAVS